MLRNLRLLKAALLLTTVCFSGTLFSQNYPEYPHQSANTALLNQFVQEIYLNCPEYTTTEHQDLELQKMNRIVIHEVPVGEYAECPLLSDVLQKNKCNPGLSFSIENFDPATFNPLKYFFKYSDNASNYYRVDGKNYIIEIKPKN